MTVLSADALLEVRGLQTWFPIRSGVLRRVSGTVRAVDGVDLTVYPGETLALVGESGCGKTTVGRSLLRLVEPTGGNIWFGGVNLSHLSAEAFKSYRQKMQIVMQDPGAALDPRLTVRDAIAEGMDAFGIGASTEARTQRVADLMRRVSLDPELMWRYPHEFSGGQRQRICIARALAVEPVLLICDEATSALDVSIQAQILNLLADLKAERRLTYLFITHDLAVVRYFADRVAVMYLGRIVELGRTGAHLCKPGTSVYQSAACLDPIARSGMAAHQTDGARRCALTSPPTIGLPLSPTLSGAARPMQLERAAGRAAAGWAVTLRANAHCRRQRQRRRRAAADERRWRSAPRQCWRRARR